MSINFNRRKWVRDIKMAKFIKTPNPKNPKEKGRFY